MIEAESYTAKKMTVILISECLFKFHGENTAKQEPSWCVCVWVSTVVLF